MLKGTHTIIASAGLRENFLGDWADDDFKRNDDVTYYYH